MEWPIASLMLVFLLYIGLHFSWFETHNRMVVVIVVSSVNF